MLARLSKQNWKPENPQGTQKPANDPKRYYYPRPGSHSSLSPTAPHQLFNTSSLSSSPNMGAASKAMGIVPSCLKLGDFIFRRL